MFRHRANYSEQGPVLKWVTEDQVEELHLASLEVLERTGMQIDHPEALKLLKDAGCIVEKNRVRIPGWLVEEAIRLAPRKITISNRLGERVMHLEKNRVYFGSGSDLPFTIDFETGIRRRSVKKDVEQACQVMDYLPNFDFVMSYAIASDSPSQASDLHQFEAMTRNTVKPIVFTTHNEKNTRALIEMAAAVVGGYEELRKNPFLVLYSEPISPLVHTKDGIGKMFACIEHGIPVTYVSGVVAGGTTPVTKAGCIVQMNAETLAGLVMAQLKQKGAAIIVGGNGTPLDMKHQTTLYGSPEHAMNYAILTQLSQYYQIPIFTEAGCVNAPIPDIQAGFEAGMNLLMARLSGANLVHDVGYLEGGKTASLPFLTMCNDFIDMVHYMGKGTTINEDTCGVDTIDEVGPGNNFLASPHTYTHFRDEIWNPRLFTRMFWEIWEEKGSKNMLERARELTSNILKTHQTQPLSQEATEEMARIIARVEKEDLFL
ncbi:trimethylamine methyltransferase family protein [Dehalobacterium formicoaceticum]|uniref:Trimethylamine methyltransferase family protein n=1 Tax=Dehalobacterium formicoaceticum TaxID=51515 RepID=A0ABT1Y1T3_9FIRM|nr:trimethylamine methyltransferase family protein [Dehalobacterium formicoaceticum]MCR6544835.1 trimethylamine methyltransferase family protein [Dehalobacterium formicoaceticum]